MSQNVKNTEIPLHWVEEEGTRLDASYYTQESIECRVLLDELEQNGVETDTIGDFADDIFHRSRFKRDYVNEGEGEPYLTPTDMFMFPLEPRKWIANPPDGLKADPGWILLTCSGTVGRTLISNEYLSDCILTHDLIRILPKSDSIRGYLYAYLNTWIGQSLIGKDKYGATVKHIEPHQVESVEIPRLPSIEEEINEMVNTAHRYREEAEALLREVNNDIKEELGLPPVGELGLGYRDDVPESARAFTTNSQRVNSSLRFDAPYHKPVLQEISSEIEGCEYESGKLGDAIREMFVPSRFKRAYVNDPDNGVPFLNGSHLVQVKPLDIKYLWQGMDEIEDLRLEEGWVLMTRSGTVGRIRLVDEHIEDWTASEHCLRIVPNPEVDPGYLAAFLRSDYGQLQVEGKIYGAVVDEIAESDTSLIEDLDIVLPPIEIQERIGDKVFEAYEKVGEANELEQAAVDTLEAKIESQREVDIAD